VHVDDWIGDATTPASVPPRALTDATKKLAAGFRGQLAATSRTDENTPE
jgi:hypothetical protein